MRMSGVNTSGALDTRFLQVSINSKKLMEVLNSILTQVKEHSADLKQLKDVVPKIKGGIERRIEKVEAKLHAQVQKFKYEVREDLREQEIWFKTNTHELRNNYDGLFCSLKTNEETLARMEGERKDIKAHVKGFEKSLLQQEVKSQEEYEALSKKIEDTNCTIYKIEDKLITQSEKVKLDESQINCKGTGPPQSTKPIKKQIKIHGGNSSRRNESLRVGPDYGAGKRSMQQLQHSSRLSLLQEVVEEKREKMEVSEARISFSVKKPMEEGGMGCSSEDGELGKESSLMAMMMMMMETSKQEMRGKFLMLDEKNRMNSRRIEKESQKIGELRSLVKMHEARRSEEQLIDIMRNQFKQKTYELDEEMERRVCKDSYEKERGKMLDKILILQQNMVEKAEKGEIKKMLHFLEEKIKQIIILISGDQGLYKDGAIQKVQIKCLSCDKHLENQGHCSPLDDKDSNLPSSVSRKIRKRCPLSK